MDADPREQHHRERHAVTSAAAARTATSTSAAAARTATSTSTAAARTVAAAADPPRVCTLALLHRRHGGGGRRTEVGLVEIMRSLVVEAHLQQVVNLVPK